MESNHKKRENKVKPGGEEIKRGEAEEEIRWEEGRQMKESAENV